MKVNKQLIIGLTLLGMTNLWYFARRGRERSRLEKK